MTNLTAHFLPGENPFPPVSPGLVTYPNPEPPPLLRRSETFTLMVLDHKLNIFLRPVNSIQYLPVAAFRNPPTYCTWGTSDFDAQTSGIKIEKEDEILRPVYKNRFPKCWVVASILDFLVHKSKHYTDLLWDENFFSLIRPNGVSTNPSFHTDFKNVHLTFIKSAPKKSFAQKTDFLGLQVSTVK